jgi:hypothetical protein
VTPRIEALVGQLEAIAAELDEITFEQLREAVADGAAERPAADKQLVRARRAIEKAAHALQQLGD